MDFILRDGFLEVTHDALTSLSWQFVPLADLLALDRSQWEKGWLPCATGSYFFQAFSESKVNGTVERYYITADKPTVWQFDFRFPDDKTVHHFEIEHADLSPATIAALLTIPLE